MTRVQALRRAAKWSERVRESFWDASGFGPKEIVMLWLGWKGHPIDEYPDTASRADIRRALVRGRAIIRRLELLP